MVSDNLDIQATSNLVNIRASRANLILFVVKRVLTKLVGWKTNFLSFAGRIVLVKLVMNAILNYVMQGWLYLHTCVISLTELIGTSYGT